MARLIEIQHEAKKPATENKPAADLSGKPIRVAAYCRVSTFAEEQDLSYETQRTYYSTLFKGRDHFQLVKVYGDQGLSGLTMEKRPGFLQMMEDCKAGQIDEIYTKSISRFSRNFSECLESIHELRRLGVAVHFEKEGFSTADPNIDMLLTLLSIVAQEESNSVSQAVCLAYHHRALQGDPARRAAYGYRRMKEDVDGFHPWKIEPEEAKQVRLVFEKFLDGESYSAIAKDMMAHEAERGGQKRWLSSVVKSILTNEIYKGDILFGKTYTADYLKGKTGKNNGEKEKYYIKDHHEAIVDEATFDKAAALMEEKNKRKAELRWESS